MTRGRRPVGRCISGERKILRPCLPDLRRHHRATDGLARWRLSGVRGARSVGAGLRFAICWLEAGSGGAFSMAVLPGDRERAIVNIFRRVVLSMLGTGPCVWLRRRSCCALACPAAKMRRCSSDKDDLAPRGCGYVSIDPYVVRRGRWSLPRPVRRSRGHRRGALRRWRSSRRAGGNAHDRGAHRLRRDSQGFLSLAENTAKRSGWTSLSSGTERRAQHSSAAQRKEGPDTALKTRTGDEQGAFPRHCSDALAMREKP
jgi:hypothetical protein